jgi:RHS repeat-associated protein
MGILGRRAARRGRRLVVLAAVAGLVSTSAAGLTPQPASASTGAARPHRLALLQSPRVRRVAPKAAAGGYSPAATRAKRPPRLVSEIVADRTATSSTWRDAGGALTVQEYAAPHFYRRPGSATWVPIDTDLEAVAGKPGWWRSAANSWQVSFGPAGAAGGAEQISTGGTVVGFAPQGVTSRGLAPSVSGPVASYAGLWPHADLTEQVSSDAVAEDLVLTGPGAAASYTFALSGAVARPGRAGGLEVVAGGKTVGLIPALTVTTAQAGKPVSAKVVRGGKRTGGLRAGPSVTAASGAKLTATGGQVTVSVSPKWLASLPEAAFPVVIDPSFTAQPTATELATCVNNGDACTTGSASFGQGSTGPPEYAAAWVPFPVPPATGSGQQPWALAQALLEINCEPSQCPPTDGFFVYGEPGGASAYPATADSIFDGQQLYEPPQQLSGGYSAVITPWLAGHDAGSWFGFGGQPYSVSGQEYTPTVLSIPAGDISVSFTYYQEPPAPTLTAPAAGSVQATTTPTLTTSPSDTGMCQSSSQPPTQGPDGGTVNCDLPNMVEYDFQVSTSPLYGSGQVVADSGWITQPYTETTNCGSDGCAYDFTNPSWTVPAGALQNGMTYYATVIDTNSTQNPENLEAGESIVPPAAPGPAVSFTVKLRLGAGGPSPTDTVGAPPGQTSVPSQGAPSPGLSPSSETVNMVTGDLALTVGTPGMMALSGPAQVALSYNSIQSSSQTGTGYGLTASFYPDPGDHDFPAATVPAAGTQVEPDIDVATNVNEPVPPPVPGIAPQGAYLARWTGTITLPSGSGEGPWELGGVTSGGMRIYLDGSGTAAFDDWSGADSGLAFSSASFTGTHQIEVDAWEPAGGAGTIQLFANNVNDSSAPVPEVVTSSWLTPVSTGLPPGWSLSSTAPAWTSATQAGSQVVLNSPTGATATFTNNGNGTWTPQPGDTDYLTVTDGLVQVSSSDGYLYQFNNNGQLASMTTIADDLHPDALQYTYAPSSAAGGAPAVLQSITDPVSGRSITLSYGTSTACTSTNSAGLLCGITYWDNTSTSFIYNSNGQLAEVINPGTAATPNTTLFGYDSDGRLDDIRDALAYAVLEAAVPGEPACSSTLDDSCVLDTWITYNANGQVATVTQPQPQPGAARPGRTYTYYPSATTPGAGSTAVTIAGFSPQGAPQPDPCPTPAPGCSPAGVASSVVYDDQGRITSQMNSTGLTSYTVWDSDDRPIITVGTDGEQTSTVYDSNSDVTDTYGPAPAACFDPSTIPTGVSVSSPVVGYLPLGDAQTTAGCDVAVPHTSNGYDQNINGLGDSYWANGQWAGPAALHGTGNASASSSLSADSACTDYLTNSVVYGTNSGVDLCADWPQSTTPVLEGTQLGTDGSNEWSLQMSGTIDLQGPSGDWIFCVADDQNFIMDIDGSLVLTNEVYELDGNNGDENSDFQGTYAGTMSGNCEDEVLTAGVHTIQITLQGTPSEPTFYSVGYLAPGGSGIAGLPLSWLSPSYGLKTTTTVTTATDAEGNTTTNTTTTSYSNAADNIGPEYGLATSTTVDPGGLNLTTSTTYQDPVTQGGYLQKTSTTLPAGNQTAYQNYGGTSGPAAAACGVTASTPQGGQLEQQTGPPGQAGQQRTEQFIYDVDGRQAGERIGSSSDIESQPWQCTSYDAIGRITQQTWPAANGAPARTVTYAYSVGGNPLVSSVSDASGTITATVDLLGRLVSYTDDWGQTTNVTYNQAGQVTATSGPGGDAQLGYDANSGQATTTNVNGELLASAYYDSDGRLDSVIYGNGTQAAISYDAYGNQNSLAYTDSGDEQTITSDAVTYGQAGQETSETESQPGGTLLSVSYGYDAAGRLTSATDTSGGTAASSYSYATNPGSDGCTAPSVGGNNGEGANTNRTSVTTTSGGTTDYCYNTADQLVASITSTGTSTSYSYNERGDQTDDNGTTYTWDASDRVATATTPAGQTTTSTYDALNRLIQSTSTGSGGSTVRYSYAGYTDTPVAILDGSSNILQQLVPLPGGVTVTLQYNDNIWSYTNLQGDTTATASNTGSRSSGPFTYDPWGNLNPGQTPTANTTGPNTLGAYATSGKLTNTATGTILLGARTYNPTEARFLSTDPINGGCANPYTYAFGDPLGQPDLTGQESCAHYTKYGNYGTISVQVSPGGTLAWGAKPYDWLNNFGLWFWQVTVTAPSSGPGGGGGTSVTYTSNDLNDPPHWTYPPHNSIPPASANGQVFLASGYEVNIWVVHEDLFGDVAYGHLTCSYP